MKITTIEQFCEEARKSFRNSDIRGFTIYVASKKFNSISEVKLTDSIMIGKSIYSYNDNHIGEFIQWQGRGSDHVSTRSMSDMNIPENTYNDWYCFTTREEAEEYIGRNQYVMGEKYISAFNSKIYECVWINENDGNAFLINDAGAHLYASKEALKTKAIVIVK